MEDYLKLIPKRLDKIELRKIDNKYYLLIPMSSRLDFLARKLHGEYRRLELDEVGAFVWELCDGTRTIEQIGKKVKEKFGENAEPLYERLVTFILELYKRNLILLGGWDERGG
ncbi:PqqD family protein [Thermococcus argininiproducens]|uniref:PqqD family protein n=1 Tax=Thermococcus argininiproducens TaxID=2866384 RepID=A0A9E7SCY2_9EURY|nr:PqqD family protein [Thermococcus argininiproducens]USG99936.1 PqqD family protein [Thermococcus argininiproducens]